MPGSVAIIDGGGANIASLRFALDRLGRESVLTTDAGLIRAASHVILPGVGAARAAMDKLRAAGLDTLIPRLTRPLLGICLGMQLLFTRSSEHGDHAGLDYMAGDVTPFPSTVKVPHMGWNQVEWTAPTAMAEGVPEGSFVYFVHSFVVRPRGAETVAVTEYAGRFASVVQRENIVGIQFHPEKSQAAGLRLLKNFAALA